MPQEDRAARSTSHRARMRALISPPLSRKGGKGGAVSEWVGRIGDPRRLPVAAALAVITEAQGGVDTLAGAADTVRMRLSGRPASPAQASGRRFGICGAAWCSLLLGRHHGLLMAGPDSTPPRIGSSLKLPPQGINRASSSTFPHRASRGWATRRMKWVRWARVFRS